MLTLSSHFTYIALRRTVGHWALISHFLPIVSNQFDLSSIILGFQYNFLAIIDFCLEIFETYASDSIHVSTFFSFSNYSDIFPRDQANDDTILDSYARSHICVCVCVSMLGDTALVLYCIPGISPFWDFPILALPPNTIPIH